MFEETTKEEEKLILRRIIVKTIKTKRITIHEFERPGGERIIKSLEFKPVTFVGRKIPPAESYEALTIDDLESRKELVELLNLPGVPEKRIEAFNELFGIFDDIIAPEGKVNVTEWIRALRRRS